MNATDSDVRNLNFRPHLRNAVENVDSEPKFKLATDDFEGAERKQKASAKLSASKYIRRVKMPHLA